MSGTVICRMFSMRMTPSLRSRVNWRLTVSIVSPRKSAISARDSGRIEGSARRRLGVGGNEVEQACDLLLGGPPAERQHPFARGIQLIQRLSVQATLQFPSLQYHAFEQIAGEHADLRIGRGLGRQRAFAHEGAADEIGGELQANDLLAPVRHHLAELHHAARDVRIERVFRSLCNDLAACVDLAAQRVAAKFAKLASRQGAANDAVPRLAGTASDGSANHENLTACDVHVLIPSKTAYAGHARDDHAAVATSAIPISSSASLMAINFIGIAI